MPRTIIPMHSVPSPNLRLLGSVCWQPGDDGERIVFRAERPFQLLALLACHDAPVPRSRLAGWLWPEHKPADARRNLRKVLLQAHRLCAALPQAPPLKLYGEQLRWHPATDLDDFLQACNGPDPAYAVQAYRPGLLAGLEAGLGDDALEWLARQRAWLDERWHAAARRWLDGLQRVPQEQAAAAEQVLARDPLDEAALRTLLQACTALGERTRGLRALQAYGVRLFAELGTTPSPDLIALGQALLTAPAPMVTPRVREASDSAVQAIVLAAMDTVADANHWPVLLQRMAQATHGLGSLFAGCSFTRAEDGFLLTHGLDIALGQRFLACHQDNPWARGMARVRPGRGCDQMQFTDQRTLERTAFYQEIIQPQGILNMAAIRVPMGKLFTTGGVSIAFGGPHASEHVAQAVRLLEHLAPYLQRAMTALLRWHHLRHAKKSAAGLDLLPAAVLILTAGGRMLFANARAEALLSAAESLCLREGRLAAAQPTDAPQLDARLTQATRAPGSLATLGSELWLHGPTGQPALRVSVLPMRDGRDSLQLGGRAAVLVLAD